VEGKSLQIAPTYLQNMSDGQIAELELVIDQYPFLVAAKGSNGDLLAMYYFLSRNPSLIERYAEQVTRGSVQAESRKRRKRED